MWYFLGLAVFKVEFKKKDTATILIQWRASKIKIVDVSFFFGHRLFSGTEAEFQRLLTLSSNKQGSRVESAERGTTVEWAM